MPHDAIRQWKSTGKTCTFSEYLDLIAPAQEEYIRKCTDGLTASAAHWAVNHQETRPYGLRDFTLGVVSSWDMDDVMDSKSYEEMPQKYGGSFDQAAERVRQLGAARRTAMYLAAKQLDVIGPEEYGTERLRRALWKSAPLESLDTDLLRGSVQRITIQKCRASPSLKKRQEIQKMFPLCRKGEIDLILTQPLTTFSQTACNAINTIWELQALNIPVIYEKEGIKTCSPDTETLINLSAAFAKAESGSDRKAAGSISKARAPAGFTGGSPFSICSE